MTQKLPLPQLNGDVLDYDERQTDGINDLESIIGNEINGLEPRLLQRVLPSSTTGWTVVELPNKVVILSKTFFASTVSFTGVGNMFGRNISSSMVSGGMDFHYPLATVVSVSADPLREGSPSLTGVWFDDIMVTTNGISTIRAISPTTETRHIRFSVTIIAILP